MPQFGRALEQQLNQRELLANGVQYRAGVVRVVTDNGASASTPAEKVLVVGWCPKLLLSAESTSPTWKMLCVLRDAGVEVDLIDIRRCCVPPGWTSDSDVPNALSRCSLPGGSGSRCSPVATPSAHQLDALRSRLAQHDTDTDDDNNNDDGVNAAIAALERHHVRRDFVARVKHNVDFSLYKSVVLMGASVESMSSTIAGDEDEVEDEEEKKKKKKKKKDDDDDDDDDDEATARIQVRLRPTLLEALGAPRSVAQTLPVVSIPHLSAVSYQYALFDERAKVHANIVLGAIARAVGVGRHVACAAGDDAVDVDVDVDSVRRAHATFAANVSAALLRRDAHRPPPAVLATARTRYETASLLALKSTPVSHTATAAGGTEWRQHRRRVRALEMLASAGTYAAVYDDALNGGSLVRVQQASLTAASHKTLRQDGQVGFSAFDSAFVKRRRKYSNLYVKRALMPLLMSHAVTKALEKKYPDK